MPIDPRQPIRLASIWALSSQDSFFPYTSYARSSAAYIKTFCEGLEGLESGLELVLDVRIRSGFVVECDYVLKVDDLGHSMLSYFETFHK